MSFCAVPLLPEGLDDDSARKISHNVIRCGVCMSVHVLCCYLKAWMMTVPNRMKRAEKMSDMMGIISLLGRDKGGGVRVS